MTHGSFRLALAVAALAALWIIVYWWTPASPRPTIAFQPSPEPAFEEPSPAQQTAQHEPAAPVQAPPKPGVQPPSFYQHTVARGDRAETISKKYYGTESHWQAVMRANPKTDFQNLRVGLVIRVPVDPANIQGMPSEAPRSEDVIKQPIGVDYIVEKGDTLTGLAHRFYGKASLYQWIIDANAGVLGDDGSRLRPGMKIVIPAAPAGAGNDAVR